jgi:hypothetical protein
VLLRERDNISLAIRNAVRTYSLSVANCLVEVRSQHSQWAMKPDDAIQLEARSNQETSLCYRLSKSYQEYWRVSA